VKLDDLKKLHQKKYREELGYFLVEGEHLVLELQKAALQNPALRNCELYVSAGHENWASPFQTHVIGNIQMAQIAETKTPQGIVALVPLASLQSLASPGSSAPLRPSAPLGAAALPTAARSLAGHWGERAIYLHEIQDPGNLGTILRTLAWFGSFRCLLSPGSVDPYNSKVVRASSGAIFHVPLETDIELGTLAARFERIAGLDMQGSSLQSPQFRQFDCYVFGNEARGVPREQLAALDIKPFTIPGSGAIESLNLASAVNMCVYELNRERATLRPPSAAGDVP
jgi:RNA methyltransferase, TrmH family